MLWKVFQSKVNDVPGTKLGHMLEQHFHRWKYLKIAKLENLWM